MQKNNIVEIKVLSGDAAIERSKAGRVFAVVQRRADRASVPQQIATGSEVVSHSDRPKGVAYRRSR